MQLKAKVKYSDSQEYRLQKGTDDSIGFDIPINDVVNLAPRESKLVCSGVSVEPPKGYYIELVPRSSSGKKNYRLANTIGIIDPDYTGYIKMYIENTGRDNLVAYPGDFLCQIIFKKKEDVVLEEVSELNKTERASGGFGSTDAKRGNVQDGKTTTTTATPAKHSKG